MYIEDLIIELVDQQIPLNSYDSNLVWSFRDQIYRDSGLTEKQSFVAVRILKRSYVALNQVLHTDITPYLQNPSFRLPVRQIPKIKQLTVVTHSIIGKAIKAVFPYDEETVRKIRESKDLLGQSMWDKDEKCWFFPLGEQVLQFLLSLESFDLDETLEDYKEQMDVIKENIEQYVPMLVKENSEYKLKNFNKNLSDLAKNDAKLAIFEARKYGILTWDENVSQYIDNELDEITKEFVKKDPGEKSFGINCDHHEISELSTIISNLLPVLVIIPGGDELEKMRLACDFLRSLGVSNSEMSVMFRLPSTSHMLFNEYVKFNELNSPINENTKVVFVSSKIPKPVLKSKIKFHSVLNLGYSNVHYTMRDFVQFQENRVIFSKRPEINQPRYAGL